MYHGIGNIVYISSSITFYQDFVEDKEYQLY